LYKAKEFKYLDEELHFFSWRLKRVDVCETSLPDDLKTELHALYDTLRELDEKLAEHIPEYANQARNKEKTS